MVADRAMLDSSFPPDLPCGCPPEGAVPTEGVVYRMTMSEPPQSGDFLSFFELGRPRPKKPHDLCKYFGLSVYRDLKDARVHQRRFPGTGRFVSIGVLMPERGVEKLTPSPDRETHTTWWFFQGMTGEDRMAGFVVIHENEDVAS